MWGRWSLTIEAVSWAQDYALLAQRQAHQRPMAMRGEAAQQHGVLLQAVLHPAPVQRTHAGAAAREQLEPGQGAGGAVGDEGIAPQHGSERAHRGGQQWVVAAGDQQPVAERAAMRLLEQPLLEQCAREQPLAAHACGGDFAAVGEFVELLLVELQEGRGLACVEAGRGCRVGACRLRGARAHPRGAPAAAAGRSRAASASSSRVLTLRKAASSSSKATSTTFRLPYQRSILRPPAARKAPR